MLRQKFELLIIALRRNYNKFDDQFLGQIFQVSNKNSNKEILEIID